MPKTIERDALASRLGKVLDEVAEAHTPYVVTHGEHPEAALVAYDDYRRFEELREADVLQEWERARARMEERNARFTEAEVAADVEAARSEVTR